MRKEDILKLLRAEKGYVSGEKISERLGISRTAVWKHINSLKKEGYDISSVSRRGYIFKESDILNADEIADRLKTEIIGKEIVFDSETDSTNNMAKRNSERGDGTVFAADRQTAGRGRSGKKWLSADSGGLFMSILLKPDLPPDSLSTMTLVVGLAVTKALRKLTGEEICIKWPNDIVLNKKKLCGILCEMSAEVGMLNYVVCGIGVNVGNEKFPEEIDKVACSVKSETGKTLLRSAVCAEILNTFEKVYKQFLTDGIAPLISEYKKYCITLGRDVTVIKRGETYRAYAMDVNDSGELVVSTTDGTETLYSGEVSVRGLLGYV